METGAAVISEIVMRTHIYSGLESPQRCVPIGFPIISPVRSFRPITHEAGSCSKFSERLTRENHLEFSHRSDGVVGLHRVIDWLVYNLVDEGAHVEYIYRQN
jgi:hypothetical protein